MDTKVSHQPVADPPLSPLSRSTTTGAHSNDYPTTPVDNQPRVSTEEALWFDFLKSIFELEVYKGKLNDVQDVVVVVIPQLMLPSVSRRDSDEVDLRNELGICAVRIQELESEREDKIRFLEKTAASVDTVKQCLLRTLRMLNEDDGNDVEDVGGVAERMTSTLSLTHRVVGIVELASVVERKVCEYHEMRKKERRQLESSVVSLTEENRDINTLLRVALVEKESVEKSLNRLKGNTEQKRVPLLQFAERGLHKVGFSFMMASAQTEQLIDSSNVSSASSKSDGSDYDEEIVSLVCI